LARHGASYIILRRRHSPSSPQASPSGGEPDWHYRKDRRRSRSAASDTDALQHWARVDVDSVKPYGRNVAGELTWLRGLRTISEPTP
jgi:hypothetical protein